MKRELAFMELKTHLEENERIKHSLAVEAAMRELARELNEDMEMWGEAGLLHDIDLEIVKYDLTKHGLVAADLLEKLGVEEEIIHAIKAHNPHLGINRLRKIDTALYSVDHMTRLTMNWLTELPYETRWNNPTEYTIKRYHDKISVKESEHLQIEECAEIGFTVEDFIKCILNGLWNVKSEISL